MSVESDAKLNILMRKLKKLYLIELTISKDFKIICSLWLKGKLVSSGIGTSILESLQEAEKAIINPEDKRYRGNY